MITEVITELAILIVTNPQIDLGLSGIIGSLKTFYSNNYIYIHTHKKYRKRERYVDIDKYVQNTLLHSKNRTLCHSIVTIMVK